MRLSQLPPRPVTCHPNTGNHRHCVMILTLATSVKECGDFTFQSLLLPAMSARIWNCGSRLDGMYVANINQRFLCYTNMASNSVRIFNVALSTFSGLQRDLLILVLAISCGLGSRA
jgi:hypothetical protein